MARDERNAHCHLTPLIQCSRAHFSSSPLLALRCAPRSPLRPSLSAAPLALRCAPRSPLRPSLSAAPLMSFPGRGAAVVVLQAPPKAASLPEGSVLPPKALIPAAEADPTAKRAIYIPIVGSPMEVKLRAGGNGEDDISEDDEDESSDDIGYYLDGGRFSVLRSGEQTFLVGDDDGLLRRLPTNRNVPRFVGPLLLIGIGRRGETTDLPSACTLLTWQSFM